ncbi:MAG: RNA 2',3'-cyclic phosphodiesterase [Nanoarchaeota archaeon]|nr:RNA 2',3'-cyclic phosphodiesterase [Nanoarchaeota archaeon]
MRCFISIDVPENLREELIKIQEQLKMQDLNAKFVEKDNFHLTLKFIGEISDSKIESIKEKLKQVKYRKFKTHFGKLGVFPSENYIRVIWLSLEPEQEFSKIASQINTFLPFGDKRFASHVTLARVRMIKDKKSLIEKIKKIKIPKMEFNVENFKLKKSAVMRTGPVYEDLCVYDL